MKTLLPTQGKKVRFCPKEILFLDKIKDCQSSVLFFSVLTLHVVAPIVIYYRKNILRNSDSVYFVPEIHI